MLIQTKHEADFPHHQINVTLDPVSDTELTVTQYVAWYIALKLQRFYKRFPENKAAKHALRIINKWRVHTSGSGRSFSRTVLNGQMHWTEEDFLECANVCCYFFAS